MAASGKAITVIHIFTAKTPAVAERRLKRKIVAVTSVVATPSPGIIPQKTPSAAPAATLWGESSIKKNLAIKFFIFVQGLFIARLSFPRRAFRQAGKRESSVYKI